MLYHEQGGDMYLYFLDADEILPAGIIGAGDRHGSVRAEGCEAQFLTSAMRHPNPNSPLTILHH